MARKGPHPDKALSAARIRSIKEAGRYADGNGLYLVVDPSGAKRWLLRTVVRGKRTDIGLGGLRLVSLAEAREEAATCRKIARDGGDPLAERRRASASVPTFAEAARTVHAQHTPSWRNTKHRAQWISTLERYVFPVFGDRRVDQIEQDDVLRALAPVWLEKPETARRVRQRVSTVFNWAKASGNRTGDNPVELAVLGLPKQPASERHFKALPYLEVPGFLDVLSGSDTHEPAQLAFEFLILTAARTGEVIGAKWDEINFEEQLWTVPPERMKGKREHRVPLPPRCIEVLRRAKAITGGVGFVFPGRSADGGLSNGTFLMRLRRMGLDVTPHGFRSSFRDWASEKTNIPNEVCEQALAHTIKDKTEAAYRRGDQLEKRRELMERWAEFLTSPDGVVVPIRA